MAQREVSSGQEAKAPRRERVLGQAGRRVPSGGRLSQRPAPQNSWTLVWGAVFYKLALPVILPRSTEVCEPQLLEPPFRTACNVISPLFTACQT